MKNVARGAGGGISKVEGLGSVVLAGAARRSRVRRVVRLAHTFGYAVLLGVVACVVDAGMLRGFLVGLGALMLWYSMSSWRGLRRSLTEASTAWEAVVYLFFVLWDVFAAPAGLMVALMLSSVAAGAWSFALLFLWDGLGIVLRFFLRSR